MAGTSLYNPTPLDMETQYAGIPFRFPANKRVTIKTVKTRHETLVPEDIAMKCWMDLSPKGLIMINEDDPQSLEEMRKEGMDLLEQFIRDNNRAFNENQVTLANEGRPKQRVPKDLRELNRILRDHIGVRGVDGDNSEVEIMTDEAFRSLQNKAKKETGELLALAKQALARGDIASLQVILGSGKVAAAASPTPQEPAPADLEEQPHELGVGASAEADPEAGDSMESGIVDPGIPKGREPGKPPKGMTRPNPKKAAGAAARA